MKTDEKILESQVLINFFGETMKKLQEKARIDVSIRLYQLMASEPVGIHWISSLSNSDDCRDSRVVHSACVFTVPGTASKYELTDALNLLLLPDPLLSR
jgi:hypothetical protein